MNNKKHLTPTPVKKCLSVILCVMLIVQLMSAGVISSNAIVYYDPGVEISSLVASDYQTISFSTDGLWKRAYVEKIYFGKDSNYSRDSLSPIESSSGSYHKYKVTDSGTYYYYKKYYQPTYDEGYNPVTTHLSASKYYKAGPFTFYKTTLNANGGTCAVSQVIVEAGKNCVFPQASREGYVFKGWSEASWATSGVASYTPNGDSTFYACWEKEQVPEPPTQPPTTPSARLISDCAITLSQTSYTYDGTEKKPAVTVKYGGETLAYGTDYTLVYFNNIQAGTATVAVVGLGRYSGTENRNFTIQPDVKTDISTCTVTLGQTSYTYDGNEKKPTVTVKDGSKTLTAGTDYTVAYSNNTGAGSAAVTVTGKGNYSGTVSKSFTIGARPIASATVTLSQTTYTYDGNEKKPTVTVKDGSKTLSAGTDYTVAYANNKNVGTATVTVTGKGVYTGTVTKEFAITEAPKINLTNCTVTLSQTAYNFDGTAKKPSVTVKYGLVTLNSGTDYSVSYADNIKIGTATVTVTGKGSYTGSVTRSFTIEEAKRTDISTCTVTLAKTSYTYDGTAKQPAVTVKDGSKTLANGTDYYVTYYNNTYVGTANAIVYGIGGYSGSVQKNFTILEAPKINISDCTVTLSQTSYTYDGTEKKPVVTVKHGSKTLAQDTDYSLAYSNNINAGTAKATITGKGGYTGSVTRDFTIVSTKPEFTWGRDNWNFLNSSYNGYFKNSTYREQISNSYMKVLKDNLNNCDYQIIFESGCCGVSWLDEEWGGSCYGMSSLALLSKSGLLPYSSYKSGATKLYDLSYPKIDNDVSSLVTYYQMLQVKDVIQQQYRTVPNRSNEVNIKDIISHLDNYPAVLVCYDQDNWGGHAVLAVGYEYGSYTWGGITYQGCIRICDPNSSMNYDKEFNIYFNTQSYNWTIPAYSLVKSTNGARFSYVGAEISEINEGGYLSGTGDQKVNNFVARIDAVKISNDRSVSKVIESNGSYKSMASAPGDIIEDYSYIFGNESEGTIGYNLYDANSSYKVSQDNAGELALMMDYEDCDMAVSSKAGKNAIFDKSGYVQVEGESADYDLSMTFDENYPTDWFSITVSGGGANKASLRKTDNGFILCSDNLNDVEIFANNRSSKATLSFSTDYDSVFIFEIDQTTIGVLVDTDNNGTYDTNVFNVSTGEKAILGDADGNGKVNVFDASFVQKGVTGTAGYPDYKKLDIGDPAFATADVDGSGAVNIFDAAIIQKYTTGDSSVERYGVGKAING